jgi:hypothetical protein
MNSAPSCILTYHSIDDSGSVISTSPALFRAHMQALAESSIPVVPLRNIRETRGAVALTFDDGFRNFFECAFPVLQEFQLPATVFIVTGYCGKRNAWPSQPLRPFVPDLELMSWREVREISQAGIGIGSHSVSHPWMSSLSPGEIGEELYGSKSMIEDRIGIPPDSFAYPYGDCGNIAETTAVHYRLACGTKLDFLSAGSRDVDLPRLDVCYLQNPYWLRSLGTKTCGAYVRARRLLRDLRARMVADAARDRDNRFARR